MCLQLKRDPDPCTCVCRSTLLKAIGQGLVVGFPTNLRALYVDQLEVAEGCSSVLEVVMNADKEVLTWRKQAQLLQVHMVHLFRLPPSPTKSPRSRHA